MLDRINVDGSIAVQPPGCCVTHGGTLLPAGSSSPPPRGLPVCEEPLLNTSESLPSTLSAIEHELVAHEPGRIRLAPIKPDTPPGARPACVFITQLRLQREDPLEKLPVALEETQIHLLRLHFF